MEPISITFILEWNYLTLHVTRYSPAVVGTAHLHNGKGAVGLQKEKKKVNAMTAVVRTHALRY